MSSSERPLSTNFAAELRTPAPDAKRWRAVAETAAGGEFDRLRFPLRDGLRVEPLYTAAPDGHRPGLPGSPPFARGAENAGARRHGWDIRQPVAVTADLARSHAAVLQELEGGARSILLQFDAERELPASATTVDDWDRLLCAVRLEMAGLALDSGASFYPAAALLVALWQRRGDDPSQLRGAIHADPIGTAARLGGLPQGLDTGLAQMAELASWMHNHAPGVTAAAVDSGIWHDAGADVVQDLAYSLSTGVEYLRAMERGGLQPTEAASQIVFRFSVGSEMFLEIAKLRAARMLWAAVLDRCGCAEAAGMVQEVRTARRAMTRRDPWVNILRNTACCFIGATGGAQAVVSVPFDEPLGSSDSAGRRLARNTQLLLHEESLLHQVADPAGGSWAVETLTAELCAAAWTEFTALEASGGALAALRAGTMQRCVEESAERRQRRVTRRKRPLLGVSEFANLDEKLPHRAAPAKTTRPAQSGTSPSVPGTEIPVGFDGWIALASAGDSLAAPWRLHGRSQPADPVPRTTVHRLDEPFEALREASDRFAASSGARPRVALACMGRLADHNARSSFARNLLRAGGIEAVPLRGAADVEALVAAFIESDCRDAVLCSSDTLYEAWGHEAAAALRRGGVRHLILAGQPGTGVSAWREAGVNDYIHLGCDVPAAVRPLLELLGVLP